MIKICSRQTEMPALQHTINKCICNRCMLSWKGKKAKERKQTQLRARARAQSTVYKLSNGCRHTGRLYIALSHGLTLQRIRMIKSVGGLSIIIQIQYKHMPLRALQTQCVIYTEDMHKNTERRFNLHLEPFLTVYMSKEVELAYSENTMVFTVKA